MYKIILSIEIIRDYVKKRKVDWTITAYYPDTDKWEEDMKTRRKK